jgi:ubiquinone/menaquinone biosynthesis C-methylase UbiE
VSYLLAEQAAERERLQLQSRVWEPAGEQLLARLGDGHGLRALDVGCGGMGWLRILSHWVGPEGTVVGTDVEERMLSAAEGFVAEEALGNVTLTRDDYFASTLPAGSFDLVHLRFQLAPLGRATEQVAIAARLARPGGWIVLEDPDTGSWRENPLGPAAAHLRGLILEAFARAGGDFDAGRRLVEYLREAGIEPEVAAEVVALAPGHPYLQLTTQFATSLRPRLMILVPEAELDRLMAAAGAELADGRRWGTTFTLVQAWGRTPTPHPTHPHTR